MGEDIADLVDGQKTLESKYEEATKNKADYVQQGSSSLDHRTGLKANVKSVGNDLKNSTNIFNRRLRQNPLTPDNMEKVQKDR